MLPEGVKKIKKKCKLGKIFGRKYKFRENGLEKTPSL